MLIISIVTTKFIYETMLKHKANWRVQKNAVKSVRVKLPCPKITINIAFAGCDCRAKTAFRFRKSIGSRQLDPVFGVASRLDQNLPRVGENQS